MTFTARLAAIGLLALAPFCSAQILRLAELNTIQIQTLDRTHTVLILTDGIVEEHGPWLPTFTDGYFDEAIALDLARSIVARPGWTVVLFPTIPLGTHPANYIGDRWTFPGSFTIRQQTMRDLYLDLADAIGQQGFRHVLIVDSHGGPANSVALDQASDYFHDTYQGRMTHLFGLLPVLDSLKALEQSLTPAQLAENGLSIHADALEQSTGLFLRPDLSPAGYKQAPDVPGMDFPTLIASSKKPNWPGYLGAPRYASAAIGALAYTQILEACKKITPDILDGKLDPSTLPRYGAEMSKQSAAAEAPRKANEAAQSAQHERWLTAHPVMK